MLYKKSLRQLVLFCLLVMSALWMAAAQAKLKQVIAITENEWNSDEYHVFFDDLTFGNFYKSKKIFIADRALTEWNDNTWPRNSDGSFKKVAATMVPIWDKNRVLYFFNDGTAADFVISEKKWAISPRLVKDVLRSWLIAGWPVDATGRLKQLVAINRNEWDSNKYHFFFDDLTFSNYSIFEKGLVDDGESGNRSLSNWNTGRDSWPKSANNMHKRVTAIVPNVFNPAENTYFFDDSTKANFHIANKKFNENNDTKSQWWDPSVAWPTKPKVAPFDSKIHEILNIKVQHSSSNPIYEIKADGKDQAPVHVWVRIKDKNTGQFVELDDDGSAIGSGEPLSLVTLYDYWLGPLPHMGSLLDIDKLRTDDFSIPWQISRRKIVYPSVRDVAPLPSHNGQDEIDNRGFVDGWNRYTYYVTSTEPEQEKRLCARVGSVPDYVYSCSSRLDEYTKIKASKIN